MKTCEIGPVLPPRLQTRFSQEGARQLMADWEASGLSGQAFARACAITSKTLYRWRARLHEKPGLSQVVLASPVQEQGCMRVCGVNGVRIELPLSCSQAQLRMACQAVAC